ncbi:carbohydrate ABC transporter permease [Conexibacter sp. JD483]|uniref:carbohydrate ABC transporter permease n=1 Tax=unclassified Conexibacter TaxID=2627773 RepID=UPI00271CFBC2|nr:MULTISPECIES: carbohydrate ABC transporter permease [unclassified Conexibacter]MDO8189043.1 carbohydrate ABC transporter permease [Conexibacter sp. CPCC 205706]MDO8198516.1 carbohydrate ABC transporter permease [Conexibacter sp. CPCC 205762]MDR9367602.1 carbohydrate ABC transporter permease [Conexibacter sp. JD483]
MSASRHRLGRLIGNAVLLAAVATTLAPLLWMLVTSLRPKQDVFDGALPSALTFDNFSAVLHSVDIGRQLLNSVIFAGGVTLGQLAIGIPAAYAFSQSRGRWSRWAFAVLLLTMSVPFVVVYLPNYILLSEVGLLDSHAGMILPQVASAYGIFLLRQHFQAFPRAIVEAARIDGASEWMVLWRVVVPASRSAISALAIFVFISTWNEYVWPQLVAGAPGMQTLSVGVAAFASEEAGTQWGSIMAAATIACLPTVAAFLALRRQIFNVLLEGAVKG